MRIVLMLGAFLIATTVMGQKADQIVGVWQTEKGKSKIEIYKKGDKYFGKIKWVRDNTNDDGSSPKLDENNPDPEKAKRPLVGTQIVKDLEWDSDENEWNEGEIYDPESGSTYDVFARLESADKLYIKGFIGFALLGRSTTWTRVN